MVKHTHARDPAVGPAAKPRVALNAVDGRGINMGIGAFSVSLAVKDIRASRAFYQKLGFVDFGGNIDDNWLIMKNDDCIIGLFQGMFDKNILTFNPGWDSNAQEVNPFKDVRVLQEELRAKGIAFVTEADPASTGPASFVIEDPDGNPILVDQHR
jgi:lactoylglutathione lyase